MSGGFIDAVPRRTLSSSACSCVTEMAVCSFIIWMTGGKISTPLSPAELVYFHGLCLLSSSIAGRLYGSLQLFPRAAAHIIGSNKRQEVKYAKGGPPAGWGWLRQQPVLCITVNKPTSAQWGDDSDESSFGNKKNSRLLCSLPFSPPSVTSNPLSFEYGVAPTLSVAQKALQVGH